MSRARELLDLVRTAWPVRRSDKRAGSLLDDALLLRAHEAAAGGAQSAMSACQSAGATAAQQRTQVDAIADAIRLLLARAREARSGLDVARDAMERIRLVALNAGLEGARMGEPAGKALVLVAEDVREHTGRALAALGEHTGSLDQMDRQREKLKDEIEEVQRRSADLARDLLQAQAAQRDATQALGSVGDRIRAVTRTDAETGKVVAEAAEHARALIAALATLSSKQNRAPLLGALGPSLWPLLRLLRELYRSAPVDVGEP